MRVGTDRRVFERVEGELGIRYSPQGSDREFCTTTRDISGGGIKMMLLKELALGTILDIEMFRYDTDIRTRCRGKIKWINEELLEAGIEFVNSKLLYIGRFIDFLQKK